MNSADIEARKGVRMLKKKKSILPSLSPSKEIAADQPQLTVKKPNTAQSWGKKCLKTGFVSEQILSQRS